MPLASTDATPLRRGAASGSPAELAEDAFICKGLIQGGSLTFHAASLFLPATRRDPSYALYAFCRMADDAVDNEPDADRKQKACTRLREQLDAAYAGHPWDSPIDRAFADMVRDFSMPKALPSALIEGMEWDADERRYDTISDLRAYAARVAAVVGVMMTFLMDVRDEKTLARACDLGVAMQLTNICRDVGEDAREGRLFLPMAWMRDEGLDPDAFMKNPVFCPRLAAVVRRLLREADRLYERAFTGIPGLPWVCRPAIQAAGMLYQAIGHKVESNGYDSMSTRAYVPGAEKALIASRAACAAVVPREIDPAPPLPETAFLVDAAKDAPPPRPRKKKSISPDDYGPLPPPSRTPWWRLGLRMAWQMETMIEMDRRRFNPALYADSDEAVSTPSATESPENADAVPAAQADITAREPSPTTKPGKIEPPTDGS